MQGFVLTPILHTFTMALSYYVGIALVVNSVICNGFLIGSKSHPWDGLKVTWGLNPFSSTAFANMPRTEPEATNSGFTMISGCGHPDFLGKRYMKDNDPAVILIYDVNGYIAGIQAGIPTTLGNGYPSANLKKHPFVTDGDKHYITAYFVPPDSICNHGRTSGQFQAQGTGTDLYIQNGTDPMASVRIPHQESAIASTAWVRGHCFPAMGVHYWLDATQDMSCDRFFPVFLLYNGGVLNAFGWAFQADLSSSRYEHPSHLSFAAFMNPVPSCLYNAGTLSTLHIYLNGNPQTDILCN
ncbi:uncharacterized protein LOC111101877 [Crassostrea virginica]|uniref:Uncharacterized protein LOC111101877 n=1 Tax=Crassostrea virginica TaxID=6565 RepID=A0A8B8AJM7_CRAVI|nr:uncharacterized protein LOC111101877 [Crassostrea virginica]